MTIRSIYRYLLRMHPKCFRRKYEDQMLWIFDESIRSRGAASLLFDAAVSLVRQWVLRSGYWRRAKTAMSADGTDGMAERLRRNALELHRRAWRINLLWMLGAFIVMPLSRLQMFWGPFAIIIFINAVGTYLRSRQGLRVGERANECVTLSLLHDNASSRKLYRRQLENKRDGLMEWCRFKPSEIPWYAYWYFGGRLLLVVLLVGAPTMLLRPLRPGTTYDWMALIEFLSGLIVLVVSWRYVKRLNDRAARAFQDEIDALEDPAMPPSV